MPKRKRYAISFHCIPPHITAIRTHRAINGFSLLIQNYFLWCARIVLRYDIIIFFSACNIQRAQRTHFIIFFSLYHFKWCSGWAIKLIITCILYLNIFWYIFICLRVLFLFFTFFAFFIFIFSLLWMQYMRKR